MEKTNKVPKYIIKHEGYREWLGRLKKEVKQRFGKQLIIADMAGIERSNYNRKENGEIRMSVEELFYIKDAFRTSWAHLMGEPSQLTDLEHQWISAIKEALALGGQKMVERELKHFQDRIDELREDEGLSKSDPPDSPQELPGVAS